MSKVSSTKAVASDTNREADQLAEMQAIAKAEEHFDVWWRGLNFERQAGMDTLSAWRAFKAGWLSMARELGNLPLAAKGNAA